MKLNVMERILLGGIMSTYQGTFMNLKLVREGREVLSFNEEENNELKFEQIEGCVNWDYEAAVKYQAVEINLGENVTSIIKKLLEDLNEQEKLTEQHFSIYEKFIT